MDGVVDVLPSNNLLAVVIDVLTLYNLLDDYVLTALNLLAFVIGVLTQNNLLDVVIDALTPKVPLEPFWVLLLMC